MPCSYLERDGKQKLAYHYTPPVGAGAALPQVFFLGGFKSDMNGTKATHLEALCKARGQGFLRFDYSGHGSSGGKFEEGTIGIWKQDALDMFDYIGAAPVILVGSSMGGWISLLLARERESSIAGVIGLAAAPDFPPAMWDGLDEAIKTDILTKGRAALPNAYSDEPYILTKALFDDANNHLILSEEQGFRGSLVLIQGVQDPDVPWQTVKRIESVYKKADSVDIVLIEDGDHRLSRPEDLDLIDREIVALSHKNNRIVTL